MRRLFLAGVLFFCFACGDSNPIRKTTVVPLDQGVTAPTPVPIPAPVSHTNPATVSELELRNIRTDFGGVAVPEIAPQCPEDPTTGIRCVGDNGGTARGLINGAFFTPAYRVYTTEQRKAARTALLSRGYRHFPINVFEEGGRWYHNLYPAPDKISINDALQELWDDGLYPMCFVMPDGQITIGGFNRSLCRIVVPMWEMNGPLQNDTNRMNQAITMTRGAFPGALLYVHFTATHAAGGSPEAAWWQWAFSNGVTGILYQDDRVGQSDVPDVVARVTDFLIRFGGGYHGWPRGVDMVFFESDIYQKFWDGRSEGQGLAFNQAVLDATYRHPACYSESGTNYCGQLAGYGSGGR